jgi:hypothetical protein
LKIDFVGQFQYIVLVLLQNTDGLQQGEYYIDICKVTC